MTPKRAKTIISRYNHLLELAGQFTGHSSGEVRFDDDGNIEYYSNHACNCHPEYYWEFEKSADEFYKWLSLYV